MTAIFGPEGESSPYRYALRRDLLPRTGAMFDLRTCLFVMLNPSTATATLDDPTIRRCIGFARGWGYTNLQVANLFAFRATDPRQLAKTADPVGPMNNDMIRMLAEHANLIVCAWGAFGRAAARAQEVRHMLEADGRELHHLGLTQDGFPKHPLYLRGDSKPIHWPRIRSAA